MSETLSTAKAAQLLGVEARELYELIDTRQLPAFQIEGRVVIRPEDLERVRTQRPA